ncbi:MAG: ATP-binding protein [Oscillospiraceae bacterium]|jgi:AAA15 family ATPase/GTPase|nr:ATP-binding protein [Oscillospiraceae bacterium]
MLVGFSVSNVFSFYKETNMSMVANTSDTSFIGINAFPTGRKETLLKSALVYGANASGKSNLIKAFAYMRDVVTADLSAQQRLIKGKTCFALNSEAHSSPSEFSAMFIVDGVEYEYSFGVLDGKVVSEALSKNRNRRTAVFNRTSADYKSIILTGRDFSNVEKFIENVREDTLFLSVAAMVNNPLAIMITDWFSNTYVSSNEEFDCPDSTAEFLSQCPNCKEKMHALLRTFDETLIEFDIVTERKTAKQFKEMLRTEMELPEAVEFPPSLREARDDDIMQGVKYEAYRSVHDSEGATVGRNKNDFLFESNGTQKLLCIAGPILSALETGGVVLLDEIDSRLHPLMVGRIVSMFNSIADNPKNAQLICATHNTLLLDDDIRRDQFYFAQKDARGESTLYSLSDFNGVRKSSKIQKQYLLGAFGAVPKPADFSPGKPEAKGGY